MPAPAAAAAACGQSFTAQLPDEPWPLKRLRPDLVWPLTDGTGITVAVIDTGVSDTHPDLKDQVLPGEDLLKPGHLPATCDDVGHGTMVAGIIAGRVLPSSGFHGIAPGAKILPFRVTDTSTNNPDPRIPHLIAQAIRLATRDGAKVINLSLTTDNVPDLASAVADAIAQDVVVVAAVGNGGSSQANQPVYPAAYPGVVGVGGVDENGDHVSSSPPGDFVDIAGPGFDIAGPAPQGGGYDLDHLASGTSFAAAYVSGVVALVRAYKPHLKGPAIVSRILRTADRPANGWDPDVGAGVVNPYWAVMSSADTVGVAQAPPGQVTLPPPVQAPATNIRTIAGWAAVGSVGLSGLLLVSVWVIRHGRRRNWRPGRPKPG
jgi:type VII secretion-associated serine protease mycosin